MWLINQDERKKFVFSTVDEIATHFLNKDNRIETFCWEYFFEAIVPLHIISSLNSQMLDIIRASENNVKYLLNPDSLTLNKIDKRFIEEKKIEFFNENGIKEYTINNFDNLVEEWHNKKEDNIPLHSFLGLTWRQYQNLMSTGKVYN